MAEQNVFELIDSQVDIILASSSPRRYEILHDVMGIQNFELMKPSFEEDLDKSLYRNDPIGYVCDTSRCKARGIVKDLSLLKTEGSQKDKLVICADTIMIDRDNIIYEKPGTEDVQLRNLQKFCYSDSGNPLRVVTAVTLIRWTNKDLYKIRQSFYEITEVYCDSKIPLPLLEQYVASGDGLAVAGGFKIQGISGILIKKINGDYYNVVGLPLNRLFQAIYQECCLRG